MDTRFGSTARGLAHQRLAHVALIGCSLALAPLAACSSITRGPLVALDKTAGTYREAELVYEVPLGKLGLGPVVPHYEGQVVAYQPLPTAPPGTRCGARLEVEYPHPDGRGDVGKVRLTIRTARQRSTSAATPAAGTQADPSDGLSFTETIESMPVVGDMLVSGPKATESWEWDAPKAQIDRLLADLAYHGYFDRLKLPDQVADIDARIDGRRVARSWQRIASFESFMQEARQRGQLVAYESSDESPVPGVDGTTAVLALNRQINARAGGRTIMPPGAPPAGGQMIATAPAAASPAAVPAGYAYRPHSAPLATPYAPPAAAPAAAGTPGPVLTQQPLRTQKLR
ncbi:MAG: hypothetical protein K2Y37_26860 [Pirellulales bacterium]|nr:hypothetical protein [Pirellulales bacterium]